MSLMGRNNLDGKSWLNDDGDFRFGKCQGDNVETVAREDPSYLCWILENVEDIHHEDRDVIETALNFRKRR